MGILFLVGKERETPSIVDLLLDIEKCAIKPNYNIADDKPLVLSDCVFEGIQFIDTFQGLHMTSNHTRD